MSLKRLADAAIRENTRARDALRRRLGDNHLDGALFPGGSGASPLDRRARAFADLYPQFTQRVTDGSSSRPSAAVLFDTALPLAEYLIEIEDARRGRPLVVGLAGGSGAGKTTLAGLLRLCIEHLAPRPTPTVAVSIDDFYLSPDERSRRGLTWRAPPGTHDIGRIERFLADLDAGRSPLAVPRYSLAEDRCLRDEEVPGPARLCVFEGAIVGGAQPGYETLRERIDFLVYLDAPLERLKTWRYARERAIRERSHGTRGFAAPEMHDFWEEALQPMIEHWVQPIRARADLVITIGSKHRVDSARLVAASRARGARR